MMKEVQNKLESFLGKLNNEVGLPAQFDIHKTILNFIRAE